MENNKIHGLEPNVYNKLASSHSKANMFLWVIGGLVYNFLQNDLLTISSALVIFPGIFIASFVSIPTFLINLKKMEILPRTNNVFILLGFTIWYIFDLIYPILLSILFIRIINYFF